MNEQLKKIRSEVDEMNKALGNEIVPDKSEDETDPPETDAPHATEPPATEPPDDNDTKTEPPKTESPKTEPPATEPPEDKDQIIANLRSQLADKDKKADKKETPTTEAPIVVGEQDFLGDLDPTDMTKDEFNKLLNKVYADGVQFSIKTLKSSMPSEITATVETIERMRKINEKFYESHEDLKGFPKIVSQVFSELVAINPSRTVEEVLKDTATEARKRLGLPTNPKPKDKSEDKKGGNRPGGPPPKLPQKGGNSSRGNVSKKLTGTEAEIAEMNESLGR